MATFVGSVVATSITGQGAVQCLPPGGSEPHRRPLPDFPLPDRLVHVEGKGSGSSGEPGIGVLKITKVRQGKVLMTCAMVTLGLKKLSCSVVRLPDRPMWSAL
jgi:hypothetical protein